MNEIEKILELVDYNKPNAWKELKEKLTDEVNKSNSIAELCKVTQSLIEGITELQKKLIDSLEEQRRLSEQFKGSIDDIQYYHKENFKLKELIGLEQFKNKCLLDKFEFLTKKRYQVIIKEIEDLKEI